MEVMDIIIRDTLSGKLLTVKII